jgi:hypothetical protein
MLYFLVTAMYPRFFITLDESLNSMPVTVRVGQVRLQILSQLFSTSLTSTSPGCRCRWPSRKTTDNIRIPDTPNTRGVRDDGESRTRDGGVHTIRPRLGRIRDFEEESWLGKGGDGALI